MNRERNVGETQFSRSRPMPTSRAVPLDPFSSDCLAPGKRARQSGSRGNTVQPMVV